MPITNLTPNEIFSDVPQLETTDIALAGVGQTMNLQAQALANRDAFLLGLVENALGLNAEPVVKTASASLLESDMGQIIYCASSGTSPTFTLPGVSSLHLDNRTITFKNVGAGYCSIATPGTDRIKDIDQLGANTNVIFLYPGEKITLCNITEPSGIWTILDRNNFVSPGTIRLFPGRLSIPAITDGWIECNGQFLDYTVTQNIPLHNVIGIEYGVDGFTFAVPHLPEVVDTGVGGVHSKYWIHL